MKKKILAMLLAAVLAIGLLPGAALASAAVPTQQQAYEAMIALKSQYPDGMRWTNDNRYNWKGGIYSGGGGCVAFAFILSDEAFGDLPARMLTDFEFSDVRVGDILRINNNTHSVIVLEVRDSSVVIAEGNINSSILWGRTLTKAQVLAADYMLTRYPLEAEPEKPAEPEEPAGPEEPELPTTGACGANLTWDYINGALIITGRGPMYNYSYDTVPWGNYRSAIRSVSIGSGVTGIGDSAFEGCLGLTAVTLPASLSYIGRRAFAGCANLTGVNIPEGVTGIGESAFSRCDSLADVYYGGSQRQWAGISIGADNAPLLGASIICAVSDPVTDDGPGISTNLKDDRLLLMPETAFPLRNWDNVGLDETWTYTLVRGEADAFTPDPCYALPLGVVLTINAYSGYDEFSSDSIRFYAWSDPDGDGVYDAWLSTDSGKNIIPPSEKGPIEASSYSGLFCVSSRNGGQYSQLAPYDGGTWSIPATVRITSDYLTKYFGGSTLLKIDVAAGYNEEEQKVKYNCFYLLLTGEEADPDLVEEPAEPELTFTDVDPTEWYAAPVRFAVNRGLVMGNDDGTFDPDGLLTRIQTFAILARLDGRVIAGGSWEEDATDWVLTNGVSNGSNPGGNIIREELVVMLWRYEGEPGADTSNLNGFSDSSAVDDWAGTALAWAVENGIVNGNDDGTLNPLGTATRAEAVTMIQRYCEKFDK